MNIRRSKDFAVRVKEVRGQLGLSQNELADRLGVSFATINRWENGRTRPSKLAYSQFQTYCEKMINKGLLDRERV